MRGIVPTLVLRRRGAYAEMVHAGLTGARSRAPAKRFVSLISHDVVTRLTLDCDKALAEERVKLGTVDHSSVDQSAQSVHGVLASHARSMAQVGVAESRSATSLGRFTAWTPTGTTGPSSPTTGSETRIRSLHDPGFHDHPLIIEDDLRSVRQTVHHQGDLLRQAAVCPTQPLFTCSGGHSSSAPGRNRPSQRWIQALGERHGLTPARRP